MTERCYRFLPAMEPEAYAVFHAETMTRVPGIVTRAEGKLVYTRERMVGRKKVTDTLVAEKVAELSALIEAYFRPAE